MWIFDAWSELSYEIFTSSSAWPIMWTVSGQAPQAKGQPPMTQELNEQCAHALGYATLLAEDSAFGPALYLHDAGASTTNASLLGASWTPLRVDGQVGEYFVRLCPAFSDNHDAARILEDAVERRGLWHVYIPALLFAIGSKAEEVSTGRLWYAGLEDWVALIQATPEQKARAFLAAVAS